MVALRSLLTMRNSAVYPAFCVVESIDTNTVGEVLPGRPGGDRPHHYTEYTHAFSGRGTAHKGDDSECETHLLHPSTASHHWFPHPPTHPSLLNSLQVFMHPTIYLHH